MRSREFTEVAVVALAEAETANREQVGRTAKLVLEVVCADGLVFTAGAGHSLAAVAETFYRAGGLAPVYPLYHPELLPLHGAQASTGAERRSGLAEEVLAEAGAGPSDVLVVFSTSGVNPYPVELALAAGRADVPVIAVTSPVASAAAPRRAGTTLAEQATVVLDSGVPPGDVTYPARDPRTGSVSSVVNAYLWNLVLTEVCDRADAQRVDLPLWRSSNVPGGDEANAGLLDRLRPRIPALR